MNLKSRFFAFSMSWTAALFSVWKVMKSSCSSLRCSVASVTALSSALISFWRVAISSASVALLRVGILDLLGAENLRVVVVLLLRIKDLRHPVNLLEDLGEVDLLRLAFSASAFSISLV